MIKKMLQKLISRIVFTNDFKFGGYIDYPGKGRIHDRDVWRLVKEHSRLIDRMSTKKMTEMSLMGQCILMGVIDDIQPEGNWKFYGKNAPKGLG